MKIEEWNISQKNKEFETPIYTVYKNKATSPETGIQGDFYVMDVPDWVNVIATTARDEVILVEQYRHGTEEVTLEIAGGVIDLTDDSPEIAARRELSEETGYSSEKWTSLGKVSANPAIMSNWCHLFLAEDCQATDCMNFDLHEEIAVKVWPRSEFLKGIKSGQIHHSLVVAAVSRLGLLRPEWLR